MKNVLDKRQLAYKLTANSLYGQCGAKDKFICKLIQLRLLQQQVEKFDLLKRTYFRYIYKDKYRANAEYIYGDTDSVFYTFNLKNKSNEKIVGKEALQITIEMAKLVEDYAGLH